MTIVELIMLELSNIGCVPRMEGGKFLISNPSRIDDVLRASIKENRGELIALLTPETVCEEMNPVRCLKCGSACDVYVMPNWRCSSCDQDHDTRVENTRRWIIHQKRILKQIEVNR